jgi:hypothetical protein
MDARQRAIAAVRDQADIDGAIAMALTAIDAATTPALRHRLTSGTPLQR